MKNEFDLFEELADAVRPEDMTVKKIVSDTDRALIEEARKCSSLNYQDITPMIEQADSEETKEILNRIHSHLYHLEEYDNDNL